MLHICSAFGGISPDSPLTEMWVYIHADLLMVQKDMAARRSAETCGMGYDTRVSMADSNK